MQCHPTVFGCNYILLMHKWNHAFILVNALAWNSRSLQWPFIERFVIEQWNNFWTQRATSSNFCWFFHLKINHLDDLHAAFAFVYLCFEQTLLKALSFILTAVQENQEQRSNSSQKEALSTVANRFELQEVCHNNHNDY